MQIRFVQANSMVFHNAVLPLNVQPSKVNLLRAELKFVFLILQSLTRLSRNDNNGCQNENRNELRCQIQIQKPVDEKSGKFKWTNRRKIAIKLRTVFKGSYLACPVIEAN